MCGRSALPGPPTRSRARRLAVRLERTPLTGRARDADGAPAPRRLDGGAFAQLVNDAATLRDLPRPARRRRRVRLRRPHAAAAPRRRGLTPSRRGAVTTYSEGAFAAVACHDYPTIWNPASSAPRGAASSPRRARALAPDAFAPFPTDLWLASLYAHQQVFGCLEWPAPAVPDPPAPPGAPYPAVPVLVLDGDLDVITPPADSAPRRRAVPERHPRHRRRTRSTSPRSRTSTAAPGGIVRRFLRTLSPGDRAARPHGPSCTSCGASRATRPRPPERRCRAPGTASRPLDRRAAWTAAQAVADALSRWWLISGSSRARPARRALHGDRRLLLLRPGPVPAAPPAVHRGRRGQRPATWERRAQRVRARVRIAGVRRGTLRIGWKADRPAARATISGRLGGRTIRLRMPAP